MMHAMLPKNPRAILNDLESIKRVMDEKHNATLKAKAKKAPAASGAAKGSSKKRLPLEVPVNCKSQRRVSPASFASTARKRVAPI